LFDFRGIHPDTSSLKHPAEGIEDLHGDDDEIGKEKTEQHDKREDPDFRRDLLRLALEPL